MAENRETMNPNLDKTAKEAMELASRAIEEFKSAHTEAKDANCLALKQIQALYAILAHAKEFSEWMLSNPEFQDHPVSVRASLLIAKIMMEIDKMFQKPT
jgi:hypothetical protein